MDHQLLLRKLECVGICRNALEWFLFLLVRYQIKNYKYYVNRVLSEKAVLKCGVPWLSILGPLLCFNKWSYQFNWLFYHKNDTDSWADTSWYEHQSSVSPKMAASECFVHWIIITVYVSGVQVKNSYSNTWVWSLHNLNLTRKGSQ